MDKKFLQLKEEINKAENEQSDMLPFMDDDSELAKKCLANIDNWMKEDNDEFFSKCLKNLGLCEKKGLDGQLMLYPVKSKERKLEKEEFLQMMSKLYTVKQNSNQYVHLNEHTISDMEVTRQQAQKMNKALQDYSKKQHEEKMMRAKETLSQQIQKKQSDFITQTLQKYAASKKKQGINK